MKYSIIVVAYNIEAFIGDCLESCIFPGRDDYEVIVVYNASTDGTLDAIRRVTVRHPHLFTIIENKENLGLGEGRNQGMRAAAGDYYIFVDGDDLLTPDALPVIASHVGRETPDILMINFSRLYMDGRTEPNRFTKWLEQGARNSVPERRHLLQNFGVAWNKVYARSFVMQGNLNFPTCFYEDIVWNAECIMRAASIYVIPDVLVLYRQRPGSILRSTDIRHFDAIRQHRRIAEILSREAELAANYAGELRNYSRKQMFATLHNGGRVPAGSEGRFLLEIVRTLAIYDRLMDPPKRSLRERVASLGSFPLYRAYRFVDVQETKIRKIYRRNKENLAHGLLARYRGRTPTRSE